MVAISLSKFGIWPMLAKMCIRDSYQSPETIARQHYTDTWVEQILSYPIDGIDVKSVSYTHLDVYKRQDLHILVTERL